MLSCRSFPEWGITMPPFVLRNRRGHSCRPTQPCRLHHDNTHCSIDCRVLLRNYKRDANIWHSLPFPSPDRSLQPMEKDCRVRNITIVCFRARLCGFSWGPGSHSHRGSRLLLSACHNAAEGDAPGLPKGLLQPGFLLSAQQCGHRYADPFAQPRRCSAASARYSTSPGARSQQ